MFIKNLMVSYSDVGEREGLQWIVKKIQYLMNTLYNTDMIVSSLSAYHSSEHLLKEEVFLLKDLPFYTALVYNFCHILGSARHPFVKDKDVVRIYMNSRALFAYLCSTCK